MEAVKTLKRSLLLLIASALTSLLFSGLIAQIAFAGGHSSGGTVHVRAYYRKDGTYVHAYDRAAPGTASDHSGVSPYVPSTPRPYVPNAPTASTTTASVPGVPVVPAVSDSATMRVHGYYRQDGTYVHEYIRSAPGTADSVVAVPTSRKPVNTTAFAIGSTAAAATASTLATSTQSTHTYSTSAGVRRDPHGRIKRSESAKRDFMRLTGYPHGRPGYVVDHIIPLKRDGCDCPSNMQWQTIQDAKAKDKWE